MVTNAPSLTWRAITARPYCQIHRADYHAMLHRLACAAPGVCTYAGATVLDAFHDAAVAGDPTRASGAYPLFFLTQPLIERLLRHTKLSARVGNAGAVLPSSPLSTNRDPLCAGFFIWPHYAQGAAIAIQYGHGVVSRQKQGDQIRSWIIEVRVGNKRQPGARGRGANPIPCA